MIKPWASGDFI